MLAGLDGEETTPFRTLGIMLDASRNLVMRPDHLKMWFQQKIWSKPDKSHSEETVALPEVHTGKVHHPAEDTSHATGEHPHAEDPIHYDNVAIPEVHIRPRRHQ